MASFRHIVFLIYLASCFQLAGASPAKIQPAFDSRVELVSVIFYLAGNKEYAGCKSPSYLKAVDAHFGKYREHAVVKEAARLREESHVWFGSPLSFAIHLDPDYGLGPEVRMASDGGSLDFRWTLKEGQKFAKLIQDFARQTRADVFFASQRKTYKLLNLRLEKLTSMIHTGWYESLFGSSAKREFRAVPSLMLGGNNYGPHRKGVNVTQSYALIGVWAFQPDESPSFGADVRNILIHEFAHSFVNPLVEGGLGVLKPAGEALAKARPEDFQRTGYAEDGEFNVDLLFETLVRASVILYLEENEGALAAKNQLDEELDHGWSWLPEVVDWLKVARSSKQIQVAPDRALAGYAATLLKCADHPRKPPTEKDAKP